MRALVVMQMKHSSHTLDSVEHHPTSPVTVETLPANLPDAVILKINGPLSIHNFFDFQDLSRKQTAPLLLIDLSEVPYIDSAAVGSLVGVHVSREHSGKKYAIIGANDRVQNIFRMTAVSQFLVTFPTVAEAEAALL